MGRQRPFVVTESGLVFRGSGHLYSIALTPGSTTTTLILYDNIEASGAKLADLTLAGGGNTVQFNFVPGMAFEKGIYASISGTGAKAIIGVG